MDGFIAQALLRAAGDREHSLPSMLPGYRTVRSLERLFDGVAHPVLVKDRAHRWLLMNHAWCELMRRPIEELLGRTDHDLLSREQADAYCAVDDEVFETGEDRDVEEELVLPDGTVRFLRTRKRLVTLVGPDGNLPFLMVSVADITENRKTEAVLREREQRYRATVELSPLIPWSADPQGMILDVSDRWYKHTGVTPEQSLGTAWTAALHPEDLPETIRRWAHSIRTGEPFSMEYRYRLLNGAYRWTHARAVALRGSDGEIIRWYGTLDDIHDRKLAEQALRESELRFRAMADDSPVSIWVTDAEGNGTFLSREWYEATGSSSEGDLYAAWLEALHPEERDRVEQEFIAASSRRERFQAEYRLRRADGSYAWVIDQGRPRFAADGSFLGYVGSVTDITERRAAEAALRESEAFARSVLESSPSCIRVLDLEGRLLFMNNAGHRLLETEHDALQGQTWAATLPPQYADEARRALASARAGKSSRHHAHRITRSGAVQWLDITITPVPGVDGRPVRLLSIWHDVTEIRQAREAAELARQEAEAAAARLSMVLESTMDSVVVVSNDWRVTYMNQNASRLLVSPKLAVGDDVWQVYPEEVDGVFDQHFRRAAAQQIPVAFEEFLPALNAWLEVQAYPTPEGLSVFFRDVTERRRAEQERLTAQERLAHMARHDVLTSLPNRFLFRERLEWLLAEATVPAAVLCLDLDGFKAVNDTLGHPTGDALLRLVAERLQGIVRGCDLVARLGGDEFAILQASCTERRDAQALADRILQTLAEPFSLDGEQISIGTSIGIAMAPQDGTCPNDLLKCADIALYCAKGEGRGTSCFFDPGMDKHLQAREAIKRALRGALGRGEFELHYQPLVDLNTRKVNSFEALLRWQHPERGMISPVDFIPIAEDTGLIVPIGEWVLEEACRRAASWPDEIGVAVNLSPVQFRSKALVQAVSRALKLSGLKPARLQLEITESVLLQDNASNLAVLQDLRRLGVQIAMDDFGTGYSSLGYLRSFSFDKIKLDRSFVRDLPGGPECEAIVRAVAGLASGLRITTTAEGVETQEQLSVLSANGYDQGQGYLFGKPVGSADVASVIERFRLAEGRLLPNS